MHLCAQAKRELAAQVIGDVGTDDGGLSGIEREFDDELRGRTGKMSISVDARKQWFSSIQKRPELLPCEDVWKER